MKKTVIVLIALIFSAPAMAANANIEINDQGGGWVSIDYNTVPGPNISAFALKISVDAGTITDVCDYHTGESVTGSKGYGIFPGTIAIDSNGTVTDYGTPVAPNSDPGASGTGLDTNMIIVELGSLYEDGNQPPKTGTLLVIEVSSDCNVCVDAEPLRGNIVKEDGTEETFTNLPVCGTASVCNTSDTYGYLRVRCDITDSTIVGPPDLYVGFDDLQALLYFYGMATSSCPATYAALCNRCDITDTTIVGPNDGQIGFDDLQALLYFYDQNVCL
jgi:hypothetical protein